MAHLTDRRRQADMRESTRNLWQRIKRCFMMHPHDRCQLTAPPSSTVQAPFAVMPGAEILLARARSRRRDNATFLGEDLSLVRPYVVQAEKDKAKERHGTAHVAHTVSTLWVPVGGTQ
jgi:hypothetical protein